MTITIFLESGKTFTFHGVEILSNNETGIVFTYVAVSDNKKKKGTFYKPGMVGFSIYHDNS